MEILKRIIGLQAKYWKRTVLGTALLIIGILTRLAGPYISQVIIDDIVKKPGEYDYTLFWWLMAALIGLTLVRIASSYIRAYCFEWLSMRVITDLRHRLYTHLQKMSFRFYDENRIGEIMSRMTGDIEGLRNFLAGGSISLLENAAYFIGAVIFLFTLHYKLTLIVLAVAPALAWAAITFDRKVGPAHRDIREQNAVLNTRTQENIAGIRVVKAFAKEGYEKERFQDENQLRLKKTLLFSFIWSNYYPLIDFVASLTLPLLLLAGGSMVLSGELSIGQLVAFTGYIWMINGPMRSLSALVNMLQNTISSGEKLFYYLDLGADIKDAPHARFPSPFVGHFRFENVTFRYGDRVILQDIQIDLPPGKTLAIMGHTGSGKSSIVNLLPRFYECSAGAVTVDGIDVKQVPLHALRRQIGFVTQETFLFSETIGNNIAFGRPDAPDEDILAAAQIGQAAEFVQQIPDGYDTIVGERGMGLSGGQKQRVAISRALLYEPAVLVLDDSTSAVDMETEFEIQQGLARTRAGKTTIIIAHRISSVKDADEIIILEQGRIAERGRHDDLMARRGLYYRMFMDQYKDYERMIAQKAGE